MLTSIQVRNFTIIDEIEIEFSPGMTVLTGETGAGKSIIVDAMGLVLGERGGSGLVRSGASRAELTAELFALFDEDGNGKISIGEFCELSKASGLSKAQMRAKFREKDLGNIIRYVRELQAANGIQYRPHNM